MGYGTDASNTSVPASGGCGCRLLRSPRGACGLGSGLMCLDGDDRVEDVRDMGACETCALCTAPSNTIHESPVPIARAGGCFFIYED